MSFSVDWSFTAPRGASRIKGYRVNAKVTHSDSLWGGLRGRHGRVPFGPLLWKIPGRTGRTRVAKPELPSRATKGYDSCSGAAFLGRHSRRCKGSRCRVPADRSTESNRRDDCRNSAWTVPTWPYPPRGLGLRVSIDEPTVAVGDRPDWCHPVHVPGRNPPRHETAAPALGDLYCHFTGEHRRAVLARCGARTVALSSSVD